MSANLNVLFILFICLMHGIVQAKTSDEEDAAERQFDDPYYIGLGIGQSFLKPDTGSVALTLSQDSDVAYKLFGGYQFDDHWSAELFWSDLGKAEINSQGTGDVASIEYSAFGIGGVYQFPITRTIDVFATAGVGRLDNTFTNVSGERVEDVFIYTGIGANWQFYDTWELRAEYDYYDKDAQLLSLNVVKRFGSSSRKRDQKMDRIIEQQDEVLAVMAASARQKNYSCDDFNVELETVIFAEGSIELNHMSKVHLDNMAEKLLKLPVEIRFEIRAHADSVGSALYNYGLSLVRARYVRDYLATKGIALSRMDAFGFGEWLPEQSNDSQAGRDVNRRANLVLVGVEKYADDCPQIVSPVTPLPR